MTFRPGREGALALTYDSSATPTLTPEQVATVRAQVARHATDADDERALLVALGIEAL